MMGGIQSLFEIFGESACGFLDMLHQFGYAESEVVKMYFLCLDLKIIDKDCYVNSWKQLACYLDKSKRSWSVEKSDTLKPCTFYIEYWYNPNTKLHHFRLPDWDSLEDSKTVKEGYIESYRLFNCF